VKNQNRKEMLMTYKERKVIGGVYVIKNTENGKMLLLSGTNLQSCKNRFEFSQKTGSCVNLKLQQDWKKLGGDIFTFEILEEVEKKDTQTEKEFIEDIKLLEQILIEKLDSDKLY